MKKIVAILFVLLATVPSPAQVPSGAKVYIAHGSDGFDKVLAAAIIEKRVPVVLVDSIEEAGYGIEYAADWTNNEAWINLTERQTHRVVWGYTCHSSSFWRTQDMRFAAGCLAKHMKEVVGKLEKRKENP